MSWTYSGDPAKSSRDWIRWRLGDTDSSAKLQTDAEIDAALTTWGTKELAAAQIARTVAAGYSRKVDTTMGKLRIAHSQRVKYWDDLAQTLMAESEMTGVAPWAGGISEASKESFEADTDRVDPAFVIGIHDMTENGTGAESWS